MIKAVIYDLDDLMVNSNPLHGEAWEILLEKYGHKRSDLPEDLRSKWIGMRVIDITKEIIKELDLNVNLESFYKERSKIFLELVKEKLESMPGLLYSLKLFKQNNFKIAIASSGAKDYIQIVLNKFGMSNYFDVIVSGDDVKTGKPHPETYVVACKKLKLNPKRCVVLEDATKGIESAKNAGCKCIAIRNPNTPPQDYTRADIVLSSLDELTLGIIQNL